MTNSKDKVESVIYGTSKQYESEGDMYEGITGHRSKVLDKCVLPTDYQAYYVYAHFDNDAIVYIGIGTSCRAFRAAGGHRHSDHSSWLNKQYESGSNPVEFIAVQLTKRKALLVEKEWIAHYKPAFNKMHNPNFKHEGILDKCKNVVTGLRDMGYSYTHISYLIGGDSSISRENKKAMTVWRYFNDK